MSFPLLSIIVPVYNSKDYLPSAFNSVLSQSFSDFELILVNDGSTDESGVICEHFAEKDNRIKYFKKNNGGLCSARNYGIEKASGKYLMFMDNDDEYIDNAFQVIANTIEEYDPDVVRFNRKRVQIFDDNSQKTDIFGTKGVAIDKPVKYTRDEFFQKYAQVRKSGCFAGIWNGVFKRELFENIRFDEMITAGGEDAIVNLEIYRIFQTIVFLPDVLYIYYRRTRHSVSTTFQMNQVLAISKESTLEREMIHENSVSEDDYFSYVHVYLATIIKMLEHKNSNLNNQEKYESLDNLRKNVYGLQFSPEDLKKLKIFPPKKAYLIMYAKGHYRVLLWITDLIMKMRGNS